MIVGEKVVFCPGTCPLVPEGVVAKVCHVRLPRSDETYLQGTARVVSEVVEPASIAGAESVMSVAADGKTPEEIRNDIAVCTEPKPAGKMARMLGNRGICQGVEFVRSERV